MSGASLSRPFDLGDPELRELATHASVTFSLVGDSARTDFRFVDGVPTRESVAEPDFRVVLPDDAWAELLAADPTPGRQSVLAFLRPDEHGRVEGSDLAFAQHIGLVRRVVELIGARAETDAAVAAATTADPAAFPPLDGIEGRYVRVDIAGLGTCDVYVEGAGTGTPLVLLPTAGSDTRQFHWLLADRRMRSQFRMVSFDLPWHGKSNPALGARGGSYTLDSASYVDAIASVIAALGLDRPLVYGASMAGAVVVELAARRPDVTRGVIGAQAGPRVANRRTPFLRNPRVNQTVHVSEWTYGLMSPQSPKVFRDRVWWSYSQGGYGVYDADIGYYSSSWDIDNVRHLLDGSVPVVLMSGVYDYSVPSDRTLELAGAVPGAVFHLMPELGHFPHAENPPVFREHLLWAASEIEKRTEA